MEGKFKQSKKKYNKVFLTWQYGDLLFEFRPPLTGKELTVGRAKRIQYEVKYLFFRMGHKRTPAGYMVEPGEAYFLYKNNLQHKNLIWPLRGWLLFEDDFMSVPRRLEKEYNFALMGNNRIDTANWGLNQAYKYLKRRYTKKKEFHFKPYSFRLAPCDRVGISR